MIALRGTLGETVWKFGIGRERGVEGVPIRAPLAAREARWDAFGYFHTSLGR
jgi:hypothetical protein